jgi:hypothetical protein
MAEARQSWATAGIVSATHAGSLEAIVTDLVHAANLPNLPAGFSVPEQFASLAKKARRSAKKDRLRS